jgi:hypothetical protein
VVHNMKNILGIQIIGIFYSGSWKRSSIVLFEQMKSGDFKDKSWKISDW